MSDSTPIGKDIVATFHYTLSDEAGQKLESTEGEDPVTYLHGHGNILPTLETLLVGKKPGETVEATLPPEKAYGVRKDNAIQRISKKHLKDIGRYQVGDAVPLHTENGAQLVTVVKIGHSMVDVDTNHPYAGQTLKFTLNVTETREASAEEIEHGHVHGPGGHHH